jgi:hypothetical protein
MERDSPLSSKQYVPCPLWLVACCVRGASPSSGMCGTTPASPPENTNARRSISAEQTRGLISHHESNLSFFCTYEPETVFVARHAHV